MKTLKKQIARYVAVEAVAYCVLAPLLVWIETGMCGADVALKQVVPVTLAATVYFAYSLLAYAVFYAMASKGGRSLVGFYLGSKMLILLLTFAALAVYGVASGPNVLLFALNLVALYMVYLLTSSLLYASAERKLNQK